MNSVKTFERVARREITPEEAAEILFPTPWYATPRMVWLADVMLVVGWIGTIALAIFIFSSCTPSPTTPPPDGPVVIPVGDAAASPEDRACAVLAALPCPEGTNPRCAESLRNAPSSNVSAVNVDCILGARDRGTVRGCGVRCAVP